MLLFLYNFISIISVVTSSFNIDDSVLHKLKWPGFDKTAVSNLEKTITSDPDNPNVVRIRSARQEEYLCHLPNTLLEDSQDDESQKPYYGLPPGGLMAPLFKQASCTYRLEGYWTYEVCHGRYIRQFHEEKFPNKKSKVTEYYLGTELIEYHDQQEEEKVDRPAVGKLTLETQTFTYYEVLLEGGTICDLSGEPRRTYVRYICQEGSRGDVYQLQETATCEYTVIVLTNLLCTHPDFQRAEHAVNDVDCFPVNKDMDSMPQGMSDILTPYIIGRPYHSTQDHPFPVQAETYVEVQTSTDPPVDGPKRSRPAPSKDLHKSADKQLINDILSGSYCLSGGSGWWRHEFCFSKHALQYHEDAETGRSDIYLGYWNKARHLAWLHKHPQKRPRPAAKRSEIRQLYTGGSVCDITGEQRSVEVKLRCVQNPSSPHSVAIILDEPSTCIYVLVVESQLLCDIVQQADENALLPSQL